MADIQALVTETIPNYIFDVLTCIITVSILLWLNWKMAVISFFFLPVAVYLLRVLRPRLIELARKLAESNADIAHFFFETLSASSLIRALGAEKLEHEKLKEKQSNIIKILLRSQIVGAYSGAIPMSYSLINTIVVFAYGGVLVMKGSLSIGSLVAFSIYQGRVLGPLRGLMDGYLAVQKSRVAMTRVREILDVKPAFKAEGSVTLPDEEMRGEIEFDRVSFAYEAGEPVFTDLSIRIPEAKITAIVGPSGVGKTTICHLIMRLIDPDAGAITLDGIDLKQLRTEWLRRQMALVSQDIFLFHTSILENIRFSRPDADYNAIEEASKAACIHDFIETLPEGYETVVGDRGLRLSGGQKQRISIARSLLTRPRILLMDEATAFLDASSEERLKETIHHLMKGNTIVVVSHRPSTVEGADRIIVLRRGGKAYEGAIGSPAFRALEEGERWKDSMPASDHTPV
jgi:ABC-type multidrug transport system fused ATPase/permease subunit